MAEYAWLAHTLTHTHSPCARDRKGKRYIVSLYPSHISWIKIVEFHPLYLLTFRNIGTFKTHIYRSRATILLVPTMHETYIFTPSTDFILLCVHSAAHKSFSSFALCLQLLVNHFIHKRTLGKCLKIYIAYKIIDVPKI